MKKYMFSWVTILMMAFVVCAGFVGCSNDDDEDNASGNNELIGTWQKFDSSQDWPTDKLSHVIWVFNADGIMYEHDIDDDFNIKEGSTETFKYKIENGHLYTDKLKKDGYRDDWKDNGSYSIKDNILEIVKNSDAKHYKKIK